MGYELWANLNEKHLDVLLKGTMTKSFIIAKFSSIFRKKFPETSVISIDINIRSTKKKYQSREDIA